MMCERRESLCLSDCAEFHHLVLPWRRDPVGSHLNQSLEKHTEPWSGVTDGTCQPHSCFSARIFHRSRHRVESELHTTWSHFTEQTVHFLCEREVNLKKKIKLTSE
ncbi:hypothetical protein JOB18_048171 [Solea senegalensis]|uniref:Uncharacterized protein n=1 Tax=Solea senegalensis TaxID=28829 RepID=A0AAV6PGK3_SOLSE|nr:hypothetical protein JOB18_048171 [Solea senegalensis]